MLRSETVDRFDDHRQADPVHRCNQLRAGFGPRRNPRKRRLGNPGLGQPGAHGHFVTTQLRGIRVQAGQSQPLGDACGLYQSQILQAQHCVETTFGMRGDQRCVPLRALIGHRQDRLRLRQQRCQRRLSKVMRRIGGRQRKTVPERQRRRQHIAVVAARQVDDQQMAHAIVSASRKPMAYVADRGLWPCLRRVRARSPNRENPPPRATR